MTTDNCATLFAAAVKFNKLVGNYWKNPNLNDRLGLIKWPSSYGCINLMFNAL